MSSATPTLWQIEISHYSEKARWALDYKGIAYRGRAPLPGSHIPVALWLTRGRHATFPVLELDGERVGDSTAIIAALERHQPDPPLYPQETSERQRALDLEEWFDSQLGPHIRRLVFHELSNEPELFAELAARSAPPPLSRVPKAAGAYARLYTAIRFRVRSPAGAEQARSRVLAALDRLEAELGSGDYLVGDRFTVADLSAAALFYPLVLPPEGPVPLELPKAFESFRAGLKDRPGFRWVQEVFRRHR